MLSKVHCLNKMRQYKIIFSISAIGLQISQQRYMMSREESRMIML